MRVPMEDTPPGIERRMIERARAMTPAERFRCIEELNRTLDMLAEADVRRRYPEATEREIHLRIASRRVPSELLYRAFGWDVEKEGY
jgi:hypothetical protein